MLKRERKKEWDGKRESNKENEDEGDKMRERMCVRVSERER